MPHPEFRFEITDVQREPLLVRGQLRGLGRRRVHSAAAAAVPAAEAGEAAAAAAA